MKKYWVILKVMWQKELEERTAFFLARIRSLALIVAMYFLWSALLSGGGLHLSYSRAQILTYVLGMNLLRALVLSTLTDEIPYEISYGRISDYLLKPINHMFYWTCKDVANKTIHLGSAVLEVTLFIALFSTTLYLPASLLHLLLAVLVVIGAILIYFLMGYILGLAGFWTAQSGGPRFCFELVLEFCAGAYFPLDVLPGAVRTALSYLPFPYLVFYPLNIYLERVSVQTAARCLVIDFAWIAVLSLLVKIVWRRGLATYTAEGG